VVLAFRSQWIILDRNNETKHKKLMNNKTMNYVKLLAAVNGYTGMGVSGSRTNFSLSARLVGEG